MSLVAVNRLNVVRQKMRWVPLAKLAGPSVFGNVDGDDSLGTSAIQSADSAPSSGAESCARSSWITVPSLSRCSPLTESVRRRSSRAGVLRRRCATLRAQQPAATSTPAASSESALTQ